MHSGAPCAEIVGSTPSEETEGPFDLVCGPLNGARLPSCARLDLRADRTVRLPSGPVPDAYLEVLNVLDADDPSCYDCNADDSERRRVTIVRPTRASLELDLACAPTVIATIASNAPYVGLPGPDERIVPEPDERVPCERLVTPIELPKADGRDGVAARARSGG